VIGGSFYLEITEAQCALAPATWALDHLRFSWVRPVSTFETVCRWRLGASSQHRGSLVSGGWSNALLLLDPFLYVCPMTAMAAFDALVGQASHRQIADLTLERQHRSMIVGEASPLGGFVCAVLAWNQYAPDIGVLVVTLEQGLLREKQMRLQNIRWLRLLERKVERRSWCRGDGQ